MRWFVIFLLLANIVLFFWVQQESRPASKSESLAAPDVGHLRLLRDELASESAAEQDTVSVEAGPRDGGIAPELAAPVSETTVDAQPPLSAPTDLDSDPAAVNPANENEIVATETDGGSPVVPQPELHEGVVAEPAAEDGQPAIAAEGDALATISSLIQSPEPPAARGDEVRSAEPATPSTMVCRKLGPLDDDQALGVIASLAEDAKLLDDDTETYRRPDGYYVMIPPLPGRAEGRAMLQRLNDAGITDTWLFRSGENANAISLGLFSRRSGAERHAASISDRGFAVEVRERNKEFSGRFLVIGATVVDAYDDGSALPGEAKAVAVACPRP